MLILHSTSGRRIMILASNLKAVKEYDDTEDFDPKNFIIDRRESRKAHSLIKLLSGDTFYVTETFEEVMRVLTELLAGEKDEKN